MLKDNNYKILNNIIKEIYRTKNSATMRKKLLEDLKKIISFKLGVFSLGVRKNRMIYLVDSVVLSDFEREFEDKFLYLSETKYESSDYASWIFRIPESVVYQDSQIVDNDLRRKTSYYKDYLLPYGLPHIAGISLVHEENFLGALTLYKSEKDGDFNEKDMFVLNLLQPHLEGRLADDDEENTASNKKNISYILRSNYNMTSREVEIIGHVFHGKSNDEIAKELVITGNTVKKHLSHIYEKMGVSNRSQMVQFLLDHRIADVLI